MIRLIGRLLGAAVTLLFIAAAATLALNNPEMAHLSLWPWDILIPLPLWLMIMSAFAAGVLIGALAMLPSLMRQRLKIMLLTKSHSKKEQANIDNRDEKTALPPK